MFWLGTAAAGRGPGEEERHHAAFAALALLQAIPEPSIETGVKAMTSAVIGDGQVRPAGRFNWKAGRRFRVLSIYSQPQSGFCDGVSRRNFLRIGGLAMGGLAE